MAETGIKIGILGYGSIGKRHVANLEALGHRCYVYDPANKLTTHRSHVLDQADAVIIASPTDRHRRDILDVSELGKPMFVEKPIGATNRDWIDLRNLWRKDRIFVGYNLRFLNTVTAAKALLEDVKLRPKWARFTCSQRSEKSNYMGDGVILNWSHEIDLALHLLGPARVVSSYVEKSLERDILAIIVLRHDSGVISTIQIDYMLNPQVRGFTIQGEGAGICCDLNAGVMTCGDKPQSVVKDEDFNDCYMREMEAFLAFASGGIMRGCTAEQAIDVLDVCLRVREKAGLEI